MINADRNAELERMNNFSAVNFLNYKTISLKPIN